MSKRNIDEDAGHSAKKKATQWSQKFKEEYTETWPVILRSNKGIHFAFCNVCKQHFRICHGGKDDCRKHVATKKHVEMASLQASSHKVSNFFAPKDEITDSESAVMNAETLFTEFIIEHNLPISVADHASNFSPKMFPDSKISAKYGCGRSKSTAVVNELSEIKKEVIAQNLKTKPFSVATDGSSDLDLKQYPIYVWYLSESEGKIVPRVLSVPICDGRATGENIFKLIDNEMKLWSLPYEHILSLGCDNANVMTGKNKGVYGYFLKKQPKLYCAGCPCHLINLAAHKGAAKLNAKVDELLIDIYHYLEKSSIRKDSLKFYQDLNGKDQRKMLKHACTRWLSLGVCLNRLLDQWKAFKNFFESEKSKSKKPDKAKTDNVDTSKKPAEKSKSTTVSTDSTRDKSKTAKPKTAKPKSFQDMFGAPLKRSHTGANVVLEAEKETTKTSSNTSNKSISMTTEKLKESETDDSQKQPERLQRIYKCMSSAEFKLICLFLKHTIPVFEEVNLLLQEEKPLIHMLRSILEGMLRKLLIRFMKPTAMKDKPLRQVNFKDHNQQKNDANLVLGSEARDYMSQNASRLPSKVLTKFYLDIRDYFVTACSYIKDKFPLQEDVLKHAEVVNVESRTDVSFVSVKFFTNRYPALLPRDCTEDQLELEFIEYQIDESIAVAIKDLPPELDREDSRWNCIRQIKDANGNYMYKSLSVVMLGILTIPHSNAGCERCFSVIRKNHTEFRSQMGAKIAESIMVLKENKVECFNRKHSAQELKRLKGAYSKSLNQ